MKVLFVASPFKARFFEKMIPHFSKRMTCAIITAKCPAKENPPKSAKWRRVGFRTKTLLLNMIVPFRKQLQEGILEFAPDLIYTDCAPYSSEIKLLSLRTLPRVPHIIHLRGNWWTEYLAWFKRTSWRNRVFNSPVYFRNWHALATCNVVTPICRWLEKEVKRHLPWVETNVVYQGVDPSLFPPSKDGYALEHPSVAIIQNHTIYPKVRGLIRFKQVIEALPSVHFYITTGEAWSEGHFGEVKEALGPLRNVNFLDGVFWPNGVRDLLAGCDVYVLATGLDSCPTTVLEAGLMGKPVVASHVGGVPEIIVQGKTGWTVSNDDRKGWMEKLEMLTADENYANKIGRCGHEWVRQNFRWEVISRRVEEICTSAMNA